LELRTVDSADDPAVDRVLELLDRSRATLGHVPHSRVHERSSNGLILVAEAEGQEVAGVAIFDLPYDRVRLDYLVVADRHRGAGVARMLIEQLADEYEARTEIRLTCRRDFAAHSLWPQLGFVPHGEVAAKAEGHRKTVWRLPLSPRPTLFDFTGAGGTAELRVVALDVNVALDLAYARNPDRSGVLAESWVSDLVSYVYTDELLREIDRHEDPYVRREGRERVAAHFECLRPMKPLVDDIDQALLASLGPEPSIRDRSDARQVAEAEAAGVDFFVTSDDRLQRRFGDGLANVRIVQPGELAMALHGMSGELDYSPARLAQTELRQAPLRPEHVRLVSEHLVNHAQGERRTGFAQRIRSLLADYGPGSSRCVWDGTTPVALSIVREATQVDTVPVLRVKSSHPLASTIARELLGGLRTCRVRDGGGVVDVTDATISPGMERPLAAEGFVPFGQGWACRVLAGARSIAQWRAELASILPSGHVVPVLAALDRVSDARSAWEVERLLWPAKILGTGIATVLLPIKPTYAADLFDSTLAGQTLIDRPTRVALARENVYFRSPTGQTLAAPARALWYVSTDRSRRPGDRSIRAVSRIEQVEVRPPGQLHRRFGKLGVFERTNLEALARRRTGRLVAMAIRFSLTEPLARPVPLDLVQEVSGRLGHTLVLQWPNTVPEQVFSEVYGRGSAHEPV
jgi:GNAT superfamily N-acetyltransferase/predicted nucleic acid-binding protein